MKKHDKFDFWYAVNNTEIIKMPNRSLETFGTTTLNYHLVTELMDVTDQVRIREGRMLANQPQILTPESYAESLLEGFGEEADKYVQWLKENENDIKILHYGYKLKQESFSEHIVTGDIKTVMERVRETVESRDDPLSAILIGVDDPWDVCLIKLFVEIMRASATTNLTELMRRNVLEDKRKSKQIHDEIENFFLAAGRNPALINKLGARLQETGLFSKYEDRFFSLVQANKK